MRERIGSYRIESVLGEGGMGLVYKGRHESLGRDAAIKTLAPRRAGDAAFRARLLREAQAQARLQHEHIVAVYDLIEEGDELFIAMEYVDGVTLTKQIAERALPLSEALALFTQVLDALAYVHEAKIVHRDVKPSNVMVCRNGAVKIADFGIALLTDSPRMTASRERIGSPLYMSPEHLEGKSIDHRSDIYSAALVLYRMLAGRDAFHETNDFFAQVRERYEGAVDLHTVVPALPSGVCDAVAIALRHDPEQRFASIAEFRDALKDSAAGFFVFEPQPVEVETVRIEDEVPTERVSVAAAPPPEPPRHTSLAVAFAVAITVVLVIAIATLLLRSEKQPLLPNVPPKQGSMQPATVIIEPPTPAPQTSTQLIAPPRTLSNPERPKVPPFSSPATTTEDLEAKHRAELEALREAIRRSIADAEQQLGGEHYDAALKDLDDAAEKTQRAPDDFRDERTQISDLRARIVEKRVAAKAAESEAARWAQRLADIEEDLSKEHWPEAERFANGIASDPRAPDAVVSRARTLLQRAKEGRVKSFSDTTIGTTTNAVRKPSSPPRK